MDHVSFLNGCLFFKQETEIQKILEHEFWELKKTGNVTLRRVRVTIVGVEKQ
jgi:hypothetical protein